MGSIAYGTFRKSRSLGKKLLNWGKASGHLSCRSSPSQSWQHDSLVPFCLHSHPCQLSNEPLRAAQQWWGQNECVIASSLRMNVTKFSLCLEHTSARRAVGLLLSLEAKGTDGSLWGALVHHETGQQQATQTFLSSLNGRPPKPCKPGCP